jgi:hypothetical protein
MRNKEVLETVDVNVLGCVTGGGVKEQLKERLKNEQCFAGVVGAAGVGLVAGRSFLQSITAAGASAYLAYGFNPACKPQR